MHILVVEDDPELGMALSDVLADDGHVVARVDRASRALAMLETDPFDLILTDVRLPDSDGSLLLTKAKRFAPNLHVVLMTAFAQVDEAVKAPQARRL